MHLSEFKRNVLLLIVITVIIIVTMGAIILKPVEEKPMTASQQKLAEFLNSRVYDGDYIALKNDNDRYKVVLVEYTKDLKKIYGVQGSNANNSISVEKKVTIDNFDLERTLSIINEEKTK